jgi:hypothetical protein
VFRRIVLPPSLRLKIEPARILNNYIVEFIFFSSRVVYVTPNTGYVLLYEIRLGLLF